MPNLEIVAWLLPLLVIAIVVGYLATLLPEWMELLFGIPAILFTYGWVIWRRGFGEEDRLLFRRKIVPQGD